MSHPKRATGGRSDDGDATDVMTRQLAERWTWLAWAAALLMGLASWAGVFVDGVYAKEAPTWAAQGVGQDAANLCVAVPALFVSTFLCRRGSVRGALVTLGVLLYVVYSYVLYAFFVHFGPWFPVYVATLGCAFYALLGGVVRSLRGEPSRWFDARAPVRSTSVFLMVVAVVFALVWLGEIVPALVAGRTPQSVDEVRLPVNPVHVLDLALLLPGTMAMSVLLWKRRQAGFLLAVPLLVFLVMLGIAIIAMSSMMFARAIVVPPVMIAIVAVVTLVGLTLAASCVRAVRYTV